MFIISVYRPEAAVQPDLDSFIKGEEIFEPFSGIEVLGVFNTIEKANAKIDEHYDKGWQFHIEEVQGQFIRFEGATRGD